MRDRARAAQAIVRSAAYRGAHPEGGRDSLEATPARRGSSNGARAPRRGAPWGGTSLATALALLGLLDLYRGG